MEKKKNMIVIFFFVAHCTVINLSPCAAVWVTAGMERRAEISSETFWWMGQFGAAPRVKQRHDFHYFVLSMDKTIHVYTGYNSFWGAVSESDVGASTCVEVQYWSLAGPPFKASHLMLVTSLTWVDQYHLMGM